MKKRVFAWILLIAFVLLILNILVFRFYLEFSVVVYIIIIIAYIFSGGKLFRQSDEEDEHKDNDKSE